MYDTNFNKTISHIFNNYCYTILIYSQENSEIAHCWSKLSIIDSINSCFHAHNHKLHLHKREHEMVFWVPIGRQVYETDLEIQYERILYK